MPDAEGPLVEPIDPYTVDDAGAGPESEFQRRPRYGRLMRRAMGFGASSEMDGESVRTLAGMLERTVPPAAPDIGGAPHRVELRHREQRANSTLFHFDVTGTAGHLPVLVKLADADSDQVRQSMAIDKVCPRLADPCPPAEILDWERATLLAVSDHIERIDDHRLEAVKVFDAFPREGAIAMEFLPHPTLRRLIRTRCFIPFSQAPDDVLRAATNAGVWLRAFHSMPRPEGAIDRHATRAEFLSTVDELTEFLSDNGQDPETVHRASALVHAAAARDLPDVLPCGLKHGDYAPRNILVTSSSRVAVVDTPGRLWSAIYVDIGYFVAGLRTLLPRMLTGGLIPSTRTLDDIESAFLAGYFEGEAVPRQQIRLFEVLTVLARWASAVHGRQRIPLDGLARRALFPVKTRLFRRCLARSLSSLT
jgi:hypothetical protein